MLPHDVSRSSTETMTVVPWSVQASVVLGGLGYSTDPTAPRTALPDAAMAPKADRPEGILRALGVLMLLVADAAKRNRREEA
jgi:hypothetical protein